jgi:hypothetical protein
MSFNGWRNVEEYLAWEKQQEEDREAVIRRLYGKYRPNMLFRQRTARNLFCWALGLAGLVGMIWWAR